MPVMKQVIMLTCAMPCEVASSTCVLCTSVRYGEVLAGAAKARAGSVAASASARRVGWSSVRLMGFSCASLQGVFLGVTTEIVLGVVTPSIVAVGPLAPP